MQRCSSEARVRDCPPHRPEEQWLCCFARLQREISKVPTLNRKKEQSTICLTHAPGVQDFILLARKVQRECQWKFPFDYRSRRMLHTWCSESQVRVCEERLGSLLGQ